MANISIYIYLFIFTISFINSVLNPHETIQEIDDESLSQYRERYMELEDADQKGYIEPIIKPEKFDLNKDRKISRTEIRKAILYMIYPKDEKKTVGISKELKSHVRNNIDLYVNNLMNDNINYKQFGYLVSSLSAKDFLTEEMVNDLQVSRSLKIEGTQEL